MALTSPGVEVTVIDESQYIPAATNSVPYILLATAQNKVSGAGVGVAAGTLAANANKTYLITSQRDLSATFGVPFFYKTTTGTPINGYELNEYGLLAAYSALGISNRCYVQRVDIDLAELTATLVRPTGAPDANTYWLDTANSLWGLFEWNQTTSAFTNKVPLIISSSADVETGTTVPLQSIGNIGDYAVVVGFNDPDSVTDVHNYVYYKRGGPTSSQTSATDLSDLYNNWVLVGSADWISAWPTIQGTLAPTTLTAGNTITINSTNTITVPVSPNNTVTGVANAINTAAISGVYAATIGGSLYLYSDSGAIGITNGGVGTPLATLGITAGTYQPPLYYPALSTGYPRWSVGQTTPRPTGSVYQKYNNVNLGMNLVMKKYDATLGAFVQQACPIYANEAAALNELDPSGGGKNIPAGSTYGRINPENDNTAAVEIYERYATGPTIVTGDTANPTFTAGNEFTIQATSAGSSTFSSPVTVTLSGTSAADFCADVSAAAVPYVSATINSAGAIVFTHSQGGSITLDDVSGEGTPVEDAGFNVDVLGCKAHWVSGSIVGLTLSYWVGYSTFIYSASDTAPDQDPANGRLWYYSATDQVDIMIGNNGAWRGYQTVTNDVRGDDLSDTNATGPIISATAPTTQTDSSPSPLVYGDLWVDTSDLENYPKISRWTDVDGVDQWVLLDNTDGTSSNGIIFADARWAPDGTTNPITDPLPTITSLLVSDYVDLDAPDPLLYPPGMLLFNTRRSGFNVKSFEVNYFNSTTFPDESLPTETNAWVTASGNRANGSPNMGRQAQRALIVAALKSGIDTSTAAREEQRQFNLLACPQYPELITNMIALNNERNNTAFVVGDTPLRLTPEEIVTWATNADGEGLPTADGLTTGDAYSAVFYPSCQTTDLSGSTVVTAPSHMMLRTIIRSDEVAYPWLAPAGTRRGVVDNAVQIGYITAETGEFESIGVRQGLRDVLYENRINPITFVPGVGITNFGNKTTTSITSALDRINVARLVAFIRGRLEVIAKQFLFEPNDQITRNEITNAIDSLMIDLIAKRGIYDYLVVCDLSNNTPARIDRNELYVDIAIEPVKAVEFIYIPMRIKNTGEISGTAS